MATNSDIKMFINYGRSAHRSYFFPMAIRYKDKVGTVKQVWLSSITKKKQKIRKIGTVITTVFTVIASLSLLFVGKII